MTVVGFLQVAAVAEGNATVTESATDEARSHAPSFIFFDMEFPFERLAQHSGCAVGSEKVLGSKNHSKQKVAKSGNALPKILTNFYSFLQSFTEGLRLKLSQNDIYGRTGYQFSG